MDHSIILTPIVFKNIFSEKECLYIKKIVKDSDFVPATVEAREREHVVSQEDRKVLNQSLPNNDKNLWIYNRIFLCIQKANLKYKFNIKGHDLNQVLILKYEKGDFYNKHKDVGPGHAAKRRLSIIVQLSDPKDYEGCELIFEKGNLVAPKDIGSIIIFPSCLTHQVTQMLKGTRYALVSWFNRSY